jgi:Na+-driven multidrug efflux pump
MDQGFGVVFAQRFGAKDKEGLGLAFASAACLMAAFGIAIGILAVPGSNFLLRMLRTPTELLDGSVVYLSWLLGGMTVTAFYHLLTSMLLALGDSKTPTRSLFFVSILNIILSFALVSPFGIAGPAIAVLLAQLAGIAYCSWVLYKTGILAGGSLKWDSASAEELLRLGLPLGLRDSTVGVGGLIVQRYINNFGVEFVAGIAIAKRMYSLLFIAGSALEPAAGIFAAQNLGAGEYERIKQGVSAGVKLMLASSAVTMAFALLFGRFILGLLFEGEAYQISAVLDIGMLQLTILTLGLPVVYMLFLYRATLEGLGKSFISMLSGFAELLARIAAVLLLTPIAGEWGILLSDPLGWISAVVLLMIAYYTASIRLTKL